MTALLLGLLPARRTPDGGRVRVLFWRTLWSWLRARQAADPRFAWTAAAGAGVLAMFALAGWGFGWTWVHTPGFAEAIGAFALLDGLVSAGLWLVRR